jgi:hypothetical protein
MKNERITTLYSTKCLTDELRSITCEPLTLYQCTKRSKPRPILHNVFSEYDIHFNQGYVQTNVAHKSLRFEDRYVQEPAYYSPIGTSLYDDMYINDNLLSFLPVSTATLRHHKPCNNFNCVKWQHIYH